ncbi:MAG: hypothetical protein ABSA84_01590 [Gammaproteobacteria bacterium]|jgi:hypothetical protein
MPISKNHGFSQLTILIFLLVATFITLIATSWQIHVNNKTQDNFNKKIANVLANDITNRMYLNYKEFFKGPNSLYVDSTIKQKQYIDHTCYTDFKGCNSLTTAANDLTYWQQAIRDNLPNGIGNIFWCTKNKIFIINISWELTNKKKQTSFVTGVLIPYKS